MAHSQCDSLGAAHSIASIHFRASTCLFERVKWTDVVYRINNCVGEDNQWAFMQLLAYAYILSLTSLVIEVMEMMYIPPCVTCDKACVKSSVNLL